jgi:hypothetical protein
MSTNLADVIVHIDETLPLDQLKTVEDHIHKIGGVVSACNRDDQPHLICVVYDPEQVKSYDILVGVKSEGFHAGWCVLDSSRPGVKVATGCR